MSLWIFNHGVERTFFRLCYRKVSEHNKNIIYIIIGRGRPYLFIITTGYIRNSPIV